MLPYFHLYLYLWGREPFKAIQLTRHANRHVLIYANKFFDFVKIVEHLEEDLLNLFKVIS